MGELALPPPPRPRCGCGTELAPALLVCPACHALVHRERLAAIATEAEQADPKRAVELWREALALLPRGSRQYDSVAQKIDALVAEIERATYGEITKGPAAGTKWAKALAPLGIAGLLIWKFKFILVAILTKGKLLLLGLTKMSTVATMLVSLGVYWTAWGWKFAAALLGGIYIHEIGHVAALRRRGMAAGAPMFVPGVGAFVRMHEHAATPAEDARIGLAGPRWGLAASLIALAIWWSTASPFWAAVAKFTAIINLFNLMPLWQLDGSRAFSAFTRAQRWLIVVWLGVLMAVTREGMITIVLLVAGWRAFERRIPEKHDWPAFAEYALLAAAFAAFTFLDVRL